MSDNLVKDVKSIVSEILKENDEATMRKSMESALEKSATTIIELTASLEAKGTELDDSEAKITELDKTIAGLEDVITKAETAKEEAAAEKADWDTEKEELVKRAEEAEEVITDMKKDQLAAERLSDLEEAGVASKDTEVQLAKVRELSEEDYAAYKDELVSIKETIMEQIKSKEESSEEGDANNSEEAEEEAEEEETEIIPSQSDSAGLNVEVPSDEVRGKFQELGRAMANQLTKSE